MLLAAVLATSGVAEAKGARAKPSRSEPGTLWERLAALARRSPVPNRSAYSVAIARVGDPAPFLLVNPDTPLILASTTKVFTTAAALDRLGPLYRYRTELRFDGPLRPDGTLDGALVVHGGGDPALSGRLYDDDPLAVFQPWADALQRAGVRRIEKGLLLDTSFFDDERVHPHWPDEQAQNWYQAPISALSYNDNVILVRVTGGLRPGGPALLGFHPAGPHLLSLLGRVRTSRGSRAYVGIHRRGADSRTVVASGIVGTRRTWTGDITVPDPPLYLAAGFTKVLKDRGIEIGAAPTVRTEPGTPQTDPPLHVHQTPILPTLAVCNKRSQSFFAEQILKTLGAEKRGRGTWENGNAEVREFVRSLGLDPARYRLADGSGRSRENISTARAYLDFLQVLATRWPHFGLFEPTLAISGGQDGSLRRRLLGRYTRGRVFAKTGNLAGVVTFSGYVYAESGQKYAFVILINGGCSEGRGHVWQDRLITELARYG